MPNSSNDPTETTSPSPSSFAEGSWHSPKLAWFSLLLLGCSWPAYAQAPQAPPAPPAAAAPPAAPAPAGFASANLRPALGNVQTVIANLNLAHWKVPNETRATVQQDIGSMQRDLTTTLPPLMMQADAAAATGPAALAPAFAVFRNLDALYDVLLRVAETAALTGPASDAGSLEDARAGLEDGRAKLGAWLLQSLGAQDAQVVRLQAQAAPQPGAAPPAPTKIVVNDGPDTAKTRKKKPAATPAPQ
jgi:hypothetical protein